MTKEELAIRIQKSNDKIAKIEKRIAKWTTGMNEEAKAVVSACEVLYGNPGYKESYEAYKNYAKDHQHDPTVFNTENWNKGPQFEEAFCAYRDLAEAKNTLHKYEVALTKLVNFDNAEKIEIIWSFLQNWKKEVKEWVIDGCDLLGRLKANHEKALSEYKNTDAYQKDLDRYLSFGDSKWRAEYSAEKNFDEKYYSEVPSLSYKFYDRRDLYNEKELEKFLDTEVRMKYADLVNRITEKAGEIINADGLYISRSGQINGIVNGKNHDVRVETISAEGPIQRFHYRTLVHIV